MDDIIILLLGIHFLIGILTYGMLARKGSYRATTERGLMFWAFVPLINILICIALGIEFIAGAWEDSKFLAGFNYIRDNFTVTWED